MVGKYITDSRVINEAFHCQYINLGTSSTIAEIGQAGISKLIRYLTIIAQVLRRMLFFRPDLCYMAITAKGAGFYKDALIALLAKFLGGKMVYHMHNKGVSLKHDRWLDNLLYRLVFRNADVILLSEYLYPDIKKYVPFDRVRICPNGIPDVNSPSRSRIEINKNQEEPVRILFLSNLIASKGVFILLSACELLKKMDLKFHCFFVGGEGDVSTLQFEETLYQLTVQDVVTYLGRKYGPEKEEILKMADIFVHPTFNDCFPLVLLEAMQYRLPFVSTFEGGIPDVLEEGVTGFLVPQKDVQVLADRLEILIRDKELRIQMGAAGRVRYEEKFTLEHFEYRLKSILSELIQ